MWLWNQDIPLWLFIKNIQKPSKTHRSCECFVFLTKLPVALLRFSNSNLLRARVGNHRLPGKQLLKFEHVPVPAKRNMSQSFEVWFEIPLIDFLRSLEQGGGIRAQPQWTEILGARAAATASEKPGQERWTAGVSWWNGLRHHWT